MEGVRRAKAAQMAGFSDIQAEVVDRADHSLGEGPIPIDALRSPKAEIRRITRADETRWKRVLAGAQQRILPFPAIVVQPSGETGTRIEDIGFDFGANP
jgi:hypothetical protein